MNEMNNSPTFESLDSCVMAIFSQLRRQFHSSFSITLDLSVQNNNTTWNPISGLQISIAKTLSPMVTFIVGGLIRVLNSTSLHRA